jgi:hypothetical protein
MYPIPRRHLRSWLVLLGTLLLLVGCSSGNAREAERGQASRASEEARVADLQATYSAGFFDPGTPTPGPTSAALPTLDRLVLTRNLSGNGPSDELASVPADAGTVFAGALLHGLARGMVVGAIWRGEQGDVYASETTIEADAGDAWIGLPLPLDGTLPPGDYAVVVYVIVGDEGPVGLNSLVFEITSAGSQARAAGSGGGSRIQSTDDEDDQSDSDVDESESGGSETGEGDSPPIVPVEDDDERWGR